MYPQVFGKYVLERELSRGGMARVVLATLRGAGGFEKRLVVKQIRDDLAFDNQFVRRFVEEAKTTVALSHPNIVPVYELGVEQGTYFLAMELVEGVSIAELLKEKNEDGSRRVLTPEEGAYVGVEVCRALDYAHRRMRVVHRDITPRNVMIDEEGQVKLIDFGIAAPALVAGHEILGSPGHMPPEQVGGEKLGPPTDIFAVAVLLMEAWTGVAPFRRATPEECDAAMREEHPRLTELEPRLAPLDSAIDRAMRIDPKERQQQASDLSRVLRGFLQDVDVADLARTLGDRVRHLRENASAEPPPSLANGPRSSYASHGDLGTKTFAARDEALQWTSSPPSKRTGPPSDDMPVASTRRLESAGAIPSRPPVALATPAAAIPRAKGDDPAMGIPTPLMVDVDDLERIHADIAAAKVQKPDGGGRLQRDIPTLRRRKIPPPDKLETIATRPFETPIDGHDPSAGRRAAAAGPKKMLAAALGGALLVGGVAFALRSSDPATQANRPVLPPMTATAPAVTSAAVAAPAASAPSSAPSESAPPTAQVPAPSPGGPPRPSAAGSGVATAAGRATVSLVGDPGTRVWVDGAARGDCPARVGLEPGPHEVRFTFDPTGESRVERFSVKSGEHVTVRSDFTSATPTIKVQR